MSKYNYDTFHEFLWGMIGKTKNKITLKWVFSWYHQTKWSDTFNHWTNPLENNITLIYIFFLWKWIRSFSCSKLSTGIQLLFAKENVNEKYSALDQCVNQPKMVIDALACSDLSLWRSSLLYFSRNTRPPSLFLPNLK